MNLVLDNKATSDSYYKKFSSFKYGISARKINLKIINL